MEEIKIMEKPEWVSWDDIHQLLLAAHKKNIEKGIVMKYAQLPGEEIRKKIGKAAKESISKYSSSIVKKDWYKLLEK